MVSEIMPSSSFHVCVGWLAHNLRNTKQVQYWRDIWFQVTEVRIEPRSAPIYVGNQKKTNFTKIHTFGEVIQTGFVQSLQFSKKKSCILCVYRFSSSWSPKDYGYWFVP